MKAVILAAGKGTRMRPLTHDKPKGLVGVLGKPLLHRLFEVLPDIIDEVILVVGYRGDMIREYFGSEFLGKTIVYVEQKELTGHIPAIKLAKPHLRKGESFLVIMGDDLYKKESFERLVRHPRAVLVHEVAHPERFGIVVPDSQGKVLDIEEKPAHPKSNLAVAGAYVLDERIFEYEPELQKGEYYLPPVIQKLAREHPVFIEKASFWMPMGYPEDIEEAEKVLSS